MARRQRTYPVTVLFFCFVLILCTEGYCRSQVVEFPGSAPGEAQGQITDKEIRLENNVATCLWTISNGKLLPAEFTDKIASKTLNLKESECFRITLTDKRQIPCSNLRIVEGPEIKTLEAAPQASCLAKRFAGKSIVAKLVCPDSGLTVIWTAALRDGSNYIRQTITLLAGDKQIPVKTITLIDLPGDNAHIAGTSPGSPAVCDNMFFAYEHPASHGEVVPGSSGKASGRIVCSLETNAPLEAKQSLTQNCVMGVVPEGQLRRGFLYYVERERAHPYRPFLHYNSWWDIAWETVKMDEKQCLEVIDLYGKELIEKRGVGMDSFVFDDGWDDNTTLWQILKSNFPNGFTPLTELAQRYNTHIGLWLSPWGGYGQPQIQRVEYGRKQGYEINDFAFLGGEGRNYSGFSLAGKKYYKHFRQRCVDMMRQYKVNFFKFDGTSTSKLPETEAMLKLCNELREIDPDLYISITAGAWASPFWLMYGDNTWRGGDDILFYGKGTKRQQWLSYRDKITYENFVQKGPLYPLNSLMVCGIINTPHGPPASMAFSGDDFVQEIRSFFATGTNLQELYIKPALMTDAMWDTLAESVRWSRANADVLVDTHWIGGNPARLEIYGWASWSKNKSILSLRNPDETRRKISIDIAKALELPVAAPKKYSLKSPWLCDSNKPELALTAGVEYNFEMEPFEVLVFDVSALD